MQITFPSLRFWARHGAIPAERDTGGDFETAVVLHINDAQVHGALFSDCLQDTVNYADVYKLIRHEMSLPSNLLENVAARIAKGILRDFSLVRQVDVSVTKCSPPISGYCGKGVTVGFSLKRRLAVWDFDGTIADTAPGIIRTMTATFERLGWPSPTAADIRATIGLPLLQSIARLAPARSGEEVKVANDLYRELFEEIGTTGVSLFPGVAEAMRSQHENGFFTAIATSRGHQSAEELCVRLGIRPFLDYIVGCEDVTSHKPCPAPVKLLCKMANVPPSETFVVGDTTFDVLMGINARAAHVIGVGWGNHSSEKLLAAGACCVAGSPSELTSKALYDLAALP